MVGEFRENIDLDLVFVQRLHDHECSRKARQINCRHVVGSRLKIRAYVRAVRVNRYPTPIAIGRMTFSPNVYLIIGGKGQAGNPACICVSLYKISNQPFLLCVGGRGKDHQYNEEH